MVVERGDRMPWYDGPALLHLLESIDIETDLNFHDFRFPVQWVCRRVGTAHGDFRGYMGRIESGTLQAGDPVRILPSGRSSRVKQILTFDRELDYAFAPQSVTLVLQDELDVSRGDMIVKSRDDVQMAGEFTADVCWLGERPLDLRRKYLVKHGTKTVKGRISSIVSM